MQDKIKSILPHLIIIFSIYFGSTFANGFCFGDEVLNILGLKSWTGNQSGSHITIIYSLGIALVGIFLLIKTKKISYKTVLSNAVVYFFVVALVFGIIGKIAYKEEVIEHSNSSYKTDTFELGINGDISIKNMSILKDKKQITVPVYIEGDINMNFDDIKLIDNENNSYNRLDIFGQRTKHENDSVGGYFDVRFNVDNTKNKKYYKIAFIDSQGEMFVHYIYHKKLMN
jgi:hypothetical protein